VDLLKFIKEKGVFVKCRIGGPMFNPANQKRTTAREDILRKQKEREDGKDDVTR
jgi:hypothetical protein